MAKQKNNPRATEVSAAIIGYEAELWKMAGVLRGIEGRIAHVDTFHDDRFPNLKADFILANPPFNVSDRGGERLSVDKRWKYGVPPPGNANFGWSYER